MGDDLLMRRLLVLPLALVLASCGTAGARTARTAAEPLPLVMGGTAPVSVGPNLIGPFPLDGVYTYERDTRCPGASDTLPSLSVTVCWRGKALEYLVSEVAAKRLIPGRAFTVCDWSYSAPASWAACVETQIRNATPEIRFARSPSWVAGSINGEPYTGCAAGISGDPIFVSLAQPVRTWGLHGWEAANEFLWRTMDRADLTDGPLVAEATTKATAACSGQ